MKFKQHPSGPFNFWACEVHEYVATNSRYCWGKGGEATLLRARKASDSLVHWYSAVDLFQSCSSHVAKNPTD
eukprot:scaffold351060_cov20-Prasinocladus_malaysianus.AAC.1